MVRSVQAIKRWYGQSTGKQLGCCVVVEVEVCRSSCRIASSEERAGEVVGPVLGSEVLPPMRSDRSPVHDVVTVILRLCALTDVVGVLDHGLSLRVEVRRVAAGVDVGTRYSEGRTSEQDEQEEH